jgi:hypothetical protein
MVRCWPRSCTHTRPPGADRCEVVGGSFFDAVPPGGDVYLLKHIIHDWDDARSVGILRRCREAMGPGAVLLVIEMVAPERPDAGDVARRVARMDLQMLVLTPGGRERTEAEFRSLLGEAGFELRATIRTDSRFYFLEAVPA